MIEVSRTTHTYLTMDKDELYEAIRQHLAPRLNRPLPANASLAINPNGVIIEFTEHEGPGDQRTTNATPALDPQEEGGLRQALNDELCDNLAPPPERLEKYISPTADQNEWVVFPEKRAKKPDPCNKPWPPFPPADRKHLSQS